MNKQLQWWVFSITVVIMIMSSTVLSVNASDQEEASEHYYYILIDRFVNADQTNYDRIEREDPQGFHGGDLQGIISRLDHMNDLGITDIILSPIYEAEHYDGTGIIDDQTIHELYGSPAVFEELTEQAERRDQSIVLDVSVSHPLSSSHAQFDASFVDSDGYLSFDEEAALEHVYDRLNYWHETYGIDHFYINHIDQIPMDQLSEWRDTEEWTILGKLENFSYETGDAYLSSGAADRILDDEFFTDAIETFKEPQTSLDVVLNRLDRDSDYQSSYIHYMDHVNETRFTRYLEETGYHPVTRWTMTLTYLFGTTEHPLMFQGTEIPSDGAIEDHSHHAMINQLAGDDQLSIHVERLSQARERFISLSEGASDVVYHDGSFAVIKREADGETTYMAINNEVETLTAELPVDVVGENMQLRGVLDDDLIREDNGVYHMTLDREQIKLYVLQPDSGIYWPLVSLFGGVMLLFVGFVVFVTLRNRNRDDETL